MNKQEIDVVLKYCTDSYNGISPASGYDTIYKVLKSRLPDRLAGESSRPQEDNTTDTLIELGPAYTLLPSMLSDTSIRKYKGVDPFLSDRTKNSIVYVRAFHDENDLSPLKFYLFADDALTFFQNHLNLQGIVVSTDVLNRKVIGGLSCDSKDHELIDKYATELSNGIYRVTPENSFTVHIYVDDYFSKKLLDAGFKKKEEYLFFK